MKKVALLLLLFGFILQAQVKPTIQLEEIVRIETELASDKMEGRKIFEPGIDSASAFIENEFKKIGLSYFDDLKNYRQEFKVQGKRANNVIGILKGNLKSDEYVVFSAHFDHLGMNTKRRTKYRDEDQIYNGANDDASGTTAVIALAKYYKKLNANEKSIIFVCFTGEEVGGLGSRYFSENINADKVIAMFNIEMIGTESKWNKNSAYITGFDKSDFGTILQANLKNTGFSFYEDPYPMEQLFYRSDNAVLANLGVPAHTISTSKMDSEPHYHQKSDEVWTLDLNNMTEIIRAIAISSGSIISGKDTPTRIRKL